VWRKKVLNLRLIVSIVAISIALGILYYEALHHTVFSWQTAEASHGPLLVAVVLYLIWMRKKELRKIQIHPSIIPGVALIGIGLIMLLTGKLASTILIQKISFIVVLLGTIWMIFGYALFKVFLLPVSYLIVLTGLFEVLLSSISIYLQAVSAWIAFHVLSITGMPAILDYTLIYLPHITLDVVRECSGMNHIISLVALAIPLAFFTQKTALKKIVLILASLPIGIFGNGLRVAFIGVYAKYNHGADLHGPYETFYVSFIFFFGFLILIILSHILQRQGKKTDTLEIHEYSETKRLDNNDKRVEISTGIAIIMFLAVYLFVHSYKPNAVPLQIHLDSFPFEISELRGSDTSFIDEQLVPFAADHELLRIYSNDQGAYVKVYIGYLEIQDRERKIIDWRRSWMHYEVTRVQANNIILNKTTLHNAVFEDNIYFFYYINKKPVTSQYVGKFETFLSALLKNKTNASVIIFATNNSEHEVLPVINTLLPVIKEYLS
jgi:exosortase